MSDTITLEERALLKKVHRQRWDIDEGDMSIYRNIDGELTCKLAEDFEGPEEIARELAHVWQSAWPIVVRLETALEAAEARAEKAEAQVERLTAERDWLAQKMADVEATDEDGRFVLTCPNSKLRAVGHDCDNIACWQCWAEASRKAVAGESEGKA